MEQTTIDQFKLEVDASNVRNCLIILDKNEQDRDRRTLLYAAFAPNEEPDYDSNLAVVAKSLRTDLERSNLFEIERLLTLFSILQSLHVDRIEQEWGNQAIVEGGTLNCELLEAIIRSCRTCRSDLNEFYITGLNHFLKSFEGEGVDHSNEERKMSYAQYMQAWHRSGLLGSVREILPLRHLARLPGNSNRNDYFQALARTDAGTVIFDPLTIDVYLSYFNAKGCHETSAFISKEMMSRQQRNKEFLACQIAEGTVPVFETVAGGFLIARQFQHGLIKASGWCRVTAATIRVLSFLYLLITKRRMSYCIDRDLLDILILCARAFLMAGLTRSGWLGWLTFGCQLFFLAGFRHVGPWFCPLWRLGLLTKIGAILFVIPELVFIILVPTNPDV